MSPVVRDGAAEIVRVALAAHLGDLHVAQAGGVRRGRAGHAGKHQRGQDVDMGQPAPEPPHQPVAEVEDLFGDLALVHHVGGKQKQRHRDEGVVGVVEVEHAGGDDLEVDRKSTRLNSSHPK